MVRQVDLAAAVECPRAARISNLVSFYKPTFFASAGRAAARASPLPPPAKAGWRFSAFENAKSGLSSPPDTACNHASFAREPTHATLT